MENRVRNRRGQGALLRDEIVRAAVDLLDESGDERTLTLRSIARRAGIAAPSIYAHFPDQPAVMLAVVRSAFAELTVALSTALDAAGDDPAARLHAICHAYLDFARTHPQRYRTMFGGLWIPVLGESSVTEQDLVELGADCLGLLGEAFAGCVAAGISTSTDPATDTIALWLGLHGLAHQRAATRIFPGPPGIDDRMVTTLARLRES
ncbi:TetR/AcrR family transcriptional regulator [Actinoplanes couchii]|uniref:TetR family transcriptional regulator n=1 Tax=Actinoplanes couchii TaxID=403638 RepID=A0ABQ3XIP9_9ACTN|nr:TetR/AcrR family transcriptional regulator [Actinoplanes couchii]MDR6323898.1 AcrR family transcriptional regulator [Actinoplanes couchii]GID58369.1 TetR family transcriptional regulator [Actinoplanes couchii]